MAQHDRRLSTKPSLRYRRQDLSRRDGRLIRRQIDGHIGHVDRQAEPKQMHRGELLNIFGAFEQFLDAIGDNVTDGAIAFTQFCAGAYSTAMDRVSAATAPLAAV